MNIKRPEDKSVLKYWLPYGFMRRYLARMYGMTVRRGRLLKGNVLRSDVTGCHLLDIMPLWVVMLMQRVGCKFHIGDTFYDSEIDGFVKRLGQLTKTLESERKNSREQISALEVENLKLKLCLRDIASTLGVSMNDLILVSKKMSA